VRPCRGAAAALGKLLNKSSVLSHCPAHPQILASMQLTPLQLEAILALRSLFLRTTAALNHRRRQLAAVMQVRRFLECGSCSWHAPCEMHTLSAVLFEPLHAVTLATTPEMTKPPGTDAPRRRYERANVVG